MAKKTRTKMSAAKLKELIAAENEKKVKACMQDIEDLLKLHGCELGAIPQLVPSASGAWSIRAVWGVQVKQDDEG